MSLYLFAFLLLCCSTFAAPPAASVASSFEQANRLYEEGKFTEAATAYQDLIKTGHTSPALYFNLGNAFFKAGRIGQAVAAYRRAQRFAPRDPDIQANLQFAREQSRGPRVRTPLWSSLLAKVSLSEWTVAASLGLWCLLALLTLFQFKPSLRTVLRGTLISVALVTMVACICLAGAWLSARSTKLAVVVAPQTEARHGPLNESQPVFTAYDGAELRILDRKDEWLQVTAGPARTGWIRSSDAVIL